MGPASNQQSGLARTAESNSSDVTRQTSRSASGAYSQPITQRLYLKPWRVIRHGINCPDESTAQSSSRNGLKRRWRTRTFGLPAIGASSSPTTGTCSWASYPRLRTTWLSGTFQRLTGCLRQWVRREGHASRKGARAWPCHPIGAKPQLRFSGPAVSFATLHCR